MGDNWNFTSASELWTELMQVAGREAGPSLLSLVSHWAAPDTPGRRNNTGMPLPTGQESPAINLYEAYMEASQPPFNDFEVSPNFENAVGMFTGMVDRTERKRHAKRCRQRAAGCLRQAAREAQYSNDARTNHLGTCFLNLLNSYEDEMARLSQGGTPGQIFQDSDDPQCKYDDDNDSLIDALNVHCERRRHGLVPQHVSDSGNSSAAQNNNPVSVNSSQNINPVSVISTRNNNPVSVISTRNNNPVSGSSSRNNNPVSGNSSQNINPVSVNRSQNNNPVSGNSSKNNNPVSVNRPQNNNPVSGNSSQINNTVSGNSSRNNNPVSGNSSQNNSTVSGNSSRSSNPVYGITESYNTMSLSPGVSHGQVRPRPGWVALPYAGVNSLRPLDGTIRPSGPEIVEDAPSNTRLHFLSGQPSPFQGSSLPSQQQLRPTRPKRPTNQAQTSCGTNQISASDSLQGGINQPFGNIVFQIPEAQVEQALLNDIVSFIQSEPTSRSQVSRPTLQQQRPPTPPPRPAAWPTGTPNQPRGAESSLSSGDDVCPICLESCENATDKTFLTCAHYFHQPCLGQWLENNKTCPVCRSQVTIDIP